jgi:hypothetical protein
MRLWCPCFVFCLNTEPFIGVEMSMKPKDQTFEIEITAQVNGKTTITDYVFYNQHAEITGWDVWSGHFRDYIPMDLKKAETMWPGLFNRMQQEIIHRLITNRSERGWNESVDQDRDDKLNGKGA